MASVAVLEVFAVVIEDVILFLGSSGKHALADRLCAVDPLIEHQLKTVIFFEILQVFGIFGGEAERGREDRVEADPK